MHDAIREAHELIGATLRDPRTQLQGRVVGMDLVRDQPAIYVLWAESAAAERIAMEPEDFLALMEHLRVRRDGSRQSGSQSAAKPRVSSSASSAESRTSASRSPGSKPVDAHGNPSYARRKEPRPSEQHDLSRISEEESRATTHEVQATGMSERRSAQA